MSDQGTSFQKLLVHLSESLDRLAQLHREEVEQAQSVIALHDLSLEDVNASIPVDVIYRNDDSAPCAEILDRQFTESSSDFAERDEVLVPEVNRVLRNSYESMTAASNRFTRSDYQEVSAEAREAYFAALHEDDSVELGPMADGLATGRRSLAQTLGKDKQQVARASQRKRSVLQVPSNTSSDGEVFELPSTHIAPSTVSSKASRWKPSCVSDSTEVSTFSTLRKRDLKTQSSKLNVGRRYRQYHVRQLWFDHADFEHVSLGELFRFQSRERFSAIEEDWNQVLSQSRRQSQSGWVTKIQTGQTDTPMRSSMNMANLRIKSKIEVFILHPEARIRTLWLIACMAFLMYDVVMVPIVICFEPEETKFSDVMNISSCILWTIDILLNFMTGVRTLDGVERRLERIAGVYLKSWFLFDVVLVLPEWLMLALAGDDNFSSGLSVFRVLRWARMMRLLRLARMWKNSKMKMIARSVAFRYRLSKTMVQAAQSWMILSLFLMVIIHYLSCIWYAVSNLVNNGWVQANNLAAADVVDVYVVSVHWSFSRLHGLMSNYRLENAWEMLIDALLIYLSMALASFYIGTVTAVTMTRMTSKTADLWNMSVNFIQRHQLSSDLSFRMQKVLEASHFAGPAEIAEEENTLLQAFPSTLQLELLFEARKLVLVTSSFFRDMIEFNQRAVGHICNVAITCQIVVQAEVTFSHGDACKHMIFLDAGSLLYVLGKALAWNDSSCTFKLRSGASISEATLWTNWEHMGHLLVLKESALLSVDAANFAQVIVQHKSALVHAVRYAKHFVWNLNAYDGPSDLTAFPDLSIEHLDDNLFSGTDEDHFIFLSHYKVEAGTEATLMRDGLLSTLREDQNHPANDLSSPVFMDSEDLNDLARLKEHVVGSVSLILLLTPGVLSRPWCLIEIVTAYRNGVQIVPVEVQRPGYSYQYPDEEFYQGILAGKLVRAEGLDLLEREGVSLEDLEQALRHVFLKIAQPFSPHKSKNIRQAELQDILKRCCDEHEDAGNPRMTHKSTRGVTVLPPDDEEDEDEDDTKLL